MSSVSNFNVENKQCQTVLLVTEGTLCPLLFVLFSDVFMIDWYSYDLWSDLMAHSSELWNQCWTVDGSQYVHVGLYVMLASSYKRACHLCFLNSILKQAENKGLNKCAVIHEYGLRYPILTAQKRHLVSGTVSCVVAAGAPHNIWFSVLYFSYNFIYHWYECVCI